MHFSTKTEYANVVSFERGRGAPVSETEFPVLVDYLFENLGKK